MEQLEAFNEMGLEQRRRYFTPARLNTIRLNLDALVISNGSVLDTLQAHAFTKAYLTNIIGYLDSDFSKGSLLFMGVNKLPIGGLIYLSNAPTKPAFQDFMRQLGLEKHEHLSATARALEPNWVPDVLRRTR